MYIRSSGHEKAINGVPDGYSGTAFFESERDGHEGECHGEGSKITLPDPDDTHDDIHKDSPGSRANLFSAMKFDLNAIMSTDLLILLLVFLLLSEEKRDDELIVMLLLLLVIR